MNFHLNIDNLTTLDLCELTGASYQAYLNPIFIKYEIDGKLLSSFRKNTMGYYDYFPTTFLQNQLESFLSLLAMLFPLLPEQTQVLSNLSNVSPSTSLLKRSNFNINQYDISSYSSEPGMSLKEFIDGKNTENTPVNQNHFASTASTIMNYDNQPNPNVRTPNGRTPNARKMPRTLPLNYKFPVAKLKSETVTALKQLDVQLRPNEFKDIIDTLFNDIQPKTGYYCPSLDLRKAIESIFAEWPHLQHITPHEGAKRIKAKSTIEFEFEPKTMEAELASKLHSKYDTFRRVDEAARASPEVLAAKQRYRPKRLIEN